MDVILDLYANGKEEEFITKLKEFNIQNANAFTFIDRFGETTKNNFIDTLLKVLREDQSPLLSSPEATAAILTALRLCIREPIAIGTIDEQENVLMIVELGGLINTGRKNIIEVQEEACKCLVNMVAKNKNIEHVFVSQLGGALKIIALLHRSVDAKLVFPLCRILFHVSLQQENAKQLIDANALELMIKIITEYLKADLASMEGTPAAIVLADAFKVIFNLTLRYGPLSGSGPQPVSEPELQRIHPLVPLFEQVLIQPSTSEFIHSLKLTVVSCMLNTPKGYMRALADKEGKVLRALEGILAVQLDSTKERPTEALTPVLMLLTNLAEEVKEVRQALKEFVFPKELLDPASGSITVEAPKDLPKTAIGSKLIPHMTTVDIALKHYVNEFFYMICDENANEVCRLTGFGNAAGLLVMRGLMKLGDNSKSGRTSPQPPTQQTSPPQTPPKANEALISPRQSPQQQQQQQQPQPQVPPQPQPQPQPAQPNPYARREGESEEDHAERLAEGLQKLMDSGVVQVVRK